MLAVRGWRAGSADRATPAHHPLDQGPAPDRGTCAPCWAAGSRCVGRRWLDEAGSSRRPRRRPARRPASSTPPRRPALRAFARHSAAQCGRGRTVAAASSRRGYAAAASRRLVLWLVDMYFSMPGCRARIFVEPLQRGSSRGAAPGRRGRTALRQVARVADQGDAGPGLRCPQGQRRWGCHDGRAPAPARRRTRRPCSRASLKLRRPPSLSAGLPPRRPPPSGCRRGALFLGACRRDHPQLLVAAVGEVVDVGRKPGRRLEQRLGALQFLCDVPAGEVRRELT